MRNVGVSTESYLTAVTLLSFVLAVGFLLIILSCALWQNWLPLLVGMPQNLTVNNFDITTDSLNAHGLSALTFVLAPLPNALFSHCGSDEFAGGYEGSGPIDLGRFITSMVVVTGFALPIVLAHSEVIHPSACTMSIIGGGYVIILIGLMTLLTLLSGLFTGQYWHIPLLSNRKIRNMIEGISLSCIYAGPM